MLESLLPSGKTGKIRLIHIKPQSHDCGWGCESRKNWLCWYMEISERSDRCLSITDNGQRAGRHSYYHIREQSPQTTHPFSRLQPYVICLIMHSAYCCFDFRQYVRPQCFGWRVKIRVYTLTEAKIIDEGYFFRMMDMQFFVQKHWVRKKERDYLFSNSPFYALL